MRKGKTIPAATWETVRHDYLLGRGSCAELAAKYNLTPSAVSSKAKRERWRQQLVETADRLEKKLDAELDRRSMTMADRAQVFVERTAFSSEAFLDLIEQALAALNHRDLEALNRLATTFKTAVEVGRKSFGLDNDETADDMCLIGLELERIHQAAANGGKGVAVEVAEGGQPMRFLAQVRRFMEKYLPPMILLPK